MNTLGEAQGVALANGWVYVADGSGGVDGFNGMRWDAPSSDGAAQPPSGWPLC